VSGPRDLQKGLQKPAIAATMNSKEAARQEAAALLELSRAIAFILSILSLYPVMLSAFFVPGTRWEDRLFLSMYRVAVAACVCFASGLLFAYRPRASVKAVATILTTLPVRLFLWAMGAMAVLFTVSWYLEEYYVPLLWRNQP
jgi:hypothetical protein